MATLLASDRIMHLISRFCKMGHKSDESFASQTLKKSVNRYYTDTSLNSGKITYTKHKRIKKNFVGGQLETKLVVFVIQTSRCPLQNDFANPPMPLLCTNNP